MLRISILSLLLLSGCGVKEYQTYSLAEDVPNLEQYEKDKAYCREYAYEAGGTTLDSTIGGAVLGAAVGGVTALALGADAGYVATSTAATGGVIGFATASGDDDRKLAVVSCMQHKGYKVQGVEPVTYQ